MSARTVAEHFLHSAFAEGSAPPIPGTGPDGGPTGGAPEDTTVRSVRHALSAAALAAVALGGLTALDDVDLAAFTPTAQAAVRTTVAPRAAARSA